jgi:AraC family transcriptional regulator, arabinose operon regulatory protein
MEAGDILLIPELTCFSTEGSFSSGHLWIHFSLMPSPDLAPRVIRLRGTAATEALALALAERISHGGKDDNARVHHVALALLHLALAEVDLPSEQVPVLFRKVVRALHDDPGRKWDNEEMARLSAMSAGHFIRTFKKVMGLPPRHYLTRLRVRHAARLLAITAYSIEEIAEVSGFPNRHYFTRVFNSELKVAPAAYRRAAVLSEKITKDGK